MMKPIALFMLTWMLCSFSCAAQSITDSSAVAEKDSAVFVPEIDMQQAVQIAAKNGITPSRAYGRLARLDSTNLQWSVTESISSYSKSKEKTEDGSEIDCANTNGCTIIKSKTITIDCNSGEIKGIEKKRKVYPNYE